MKCSLSALSESFWMYRGIFNAYSSRAIDVAYYFNAPDVSWRCRFRSLKTLGWPFPGPVFQIIVVGRFFTAQDRSWGRFAFFASEIDGLRKAPMTLPTPYASLKASGYTRSNKIMRYIDRSRREGIKNGSARPNQPTGRRGRAFRKNLYFFPHSCELPLGLKKPTSVWGSGGPLGAFALHTVEREYPGNCHQLLKECVKVACPQTIFMKVFVLRF